MMELEKCLWLRVDPGSVHRTHMEPTTSTVPVPSGHKTLSCGLWKTRPRCINPQKYTSIYAHIRKLKTKSPLTLCDEHIYIKDWKIYAF